MENIDVELRGAGLNGGLKAKLWVNESGIKIVDCKVLLLLLLLVVVVVILVLVLLLILVVVVVIVVVVWWRAIWVDQCEELGGGVGNEW